MFLSIIRIIKFSFQDIFRNIWLSLVTIIILILALFSINMLLVVKAVGQTAIGAVREKVNINLFIKNSATEEEILALKAKLSNFGEIKEITYITKADALERFKDKHRDNPEILEALRELGRNPLTPTLVIKARNFKDFDRLLNRLNVVNDDIIESRNFTDYKLMLNKINGITDKVSEAGIILSSIFIFITLLVIYNSVRVAIYTHRREIMIMRLVGASHWFIQTPYLLSSVIFTFVGVAVTMGIFYVFLTLLQPYLETFFVGYNVNLPVYFFHDYIWQIFGYQFVGTVAINVLASLLAVRKYSNV